MHTYLRIPNTIYPLNVDSDDFYVAIMKADEIGREYLSKADRVKCRKQSEVQGLGNS